MRIRAAGYCAWGAAVSFVAIATVAHAAIGTAVSVAPSATNSRGGANRPLAARDPLEQNDRIRTSGEGAVLTRFNDDTTLTIGPNSEVVLDRYVFDGSRARSITVQVVRGALRFASGKSPSEVYQIKTPVATIGVRGTVVNILFEGGRLIMETPYGLSTICLTGTSNCRDLAAGGAPLSIGAGGFSPASAGDAARMNRQLQQAQTQARPTGWRAGRQRLGLGLGLRQRQYLRCQQPPQHRAAGGARRDVHPERGELRPDQRSGPGISGLHYDIQVDGEVCRPV